MNSRVSSPHPLSSVIRASLCPELPQVRRFGQTLSSEAHTFQRSHSPECCQSLVSRSLTCTVPLLNNMTSARESAMKFSREKSGEAGATAMDTVPSCGDMLVRVLRMDTSLSCSSPHSRPSPPSDASAYSSQRAAGQPAWHAAGWGRPSRRRSTESLGQVGRRHGWEPGT